jgi:hypothetical protein
MTRVRSSSGGRTAKGAGLGRFSADQARWLRHRLSGLIERLPSPVEVTRRLVGIHAQILTAAYFVLARRARGDRDFASVERLVHEERALVRLTAQRGTLHLHAPDDLAMICAGIGPLETERVEVRTRKGIASDARDSRSARRDGSSDILELERTRHACMRALLAEPRRGERVVKLSRDVFEALGCEARLGYGTFAVLSALGEAVRVERGDNATPEIAARAKWLPTLAWPVAGSPRTALKALARRYFEGYAPATEADFRYWIAAKAGDVKEAIAELSAEGEVVPVEVEGVPALIPPSMLQALGAMPPPAEAWPLRLLYRFDPLIVAHQDKSLWLRAPDHRPEVWHATHVEPVVLAHGMIRGTWKWQRKTSSLSLTVSPLGGRFSRREREGVETEALAIAKFFGLVLGGVDYLGT